jgi:tetratricopeptide (TPR) repeat protein
MTEEALHATLGVTHRAAKGPGHKDAELALSRAHELGGHRSDSRYRFSVLFGLWQVHYTRAQHPRAAQESERLMSFADASGDRQELLAANWARGMSLVLIGENAAALACHDRMRELYDAEADTSLAFKFYIEFGVGMYWVASTSLFALGFPDRALKAAEEAIARGRDQLPVHLGGSMIYGNHVPISRGEQRSIGQMSASRSPRHAACATTWASPGSIAAGHWYSSAEWMKGSSRSKRESIFGAGAVPGPGWRAMSCYCLSRI